MYLYRIAKTTYIRDLSGAGARLYGGRWNQKGTSVVYTAESRALATVEYLVHVPLSSIPRDLSIATFSIPDASPCRTIPPADLPANWRDYPAPFLLADLGTQWALANDSLMLRVPSVVVAQEYDVLLNPLHPAMHTVRIAEVEPYMFDTRLFRELRQDS